MPMDSDKEIGKAIAEVRNTDGVLLLGLRRPTGSSIWHAAVAHDAVEGERIVHLSDPAVFKALHANAATAVRIALEKSVTARREPPRIG